MKTENLVEVGVALYELGPEGVVLLCGVQASVQEQVALRQGAKFEPHRHEVLERLHSLEHVPSQDLHSCMLLSPRGNDSTTTSQSMRWCVVTKHQHFVGLGGGVYFACVWCACSLRVGTL